VAMPDRRNAPVFAAAAAFVLVLVFGKLLGSNSPVPNPNPTPTPTPTSSSSPSPKASSTGGHVGTIPTTPSAETQLTVEATEQAGATSGVPVQGITVQVLPDTRHATAVANGTLFPEANGTSLLYTTNLPSGTYQVCVQPPASTRFVGANTDAVPNWFCTKVRLAPGSRPVVFTLARAAG
jgi:hypothetical protein